jgi:dTMP kinase
MASEGTRPPGTRMKRHPGLGRPASGGSSATLARMSGGGATAGRGAFITIDGPDGGGKTTQAERLAAHLRAGGREVHLTREPGGTWLGERIRSLLLERTGSTATTDPLADALLFNAARRQLLREVIRPALDAGTTVVCARFTDSTLAYQGYGAGLDIATVDRLNELATEGLRPDLTLILDVPVEAGLARKAPGDVTRFEAEYDLDFHRRVREGFLAIAAAEPDRVALVDASRDIDDVGADIAAIVDGRLLGDEPLARHVRSTG